MKRNSGITTTHILVALCDKDSLEKGTFKRGE